MKNNTQKPRLETEPEIDNDELLLPSYRTDEFYSDRDDSRDDVHFITCPSCNGEQDDCEDCEGTGQVFDQDWADHLPTDEDYDD